MAPARPKPRPDPDKAHPVAAQLMTEPFFWDATDDASPFGSQLGDEVYPAFVRWRGSHPTAPVCTWIRRKVASYIEARSDWNTVDPAQVAALLSGPKGYEYDFRDQVILAGAFAQLAVEGRIEEEVRQLALTAVARQSTPAAIEQYKPPHQAERARRLAVMETVLKAAPG